MFKVKDYINVISEIAIDKTMLANMAAIFLISLEDVDLILKVFIGIATLIWTGFKISGQIREWRNAKNQDK